MFKGNLKAMLVDPCWQEGELEEFCLDHFNLGETEMRELAGLPFTPAVVPEVGERELDKMIRKRVKEREEKEGVEIHKNESGPPPDIKKVMTAAEKQKAYRERRKLANKLGL